MKYKLLKDYPPYKKGDILYQDGIVYHIGAPDKEYKELILTRIVEEHSDWFAPYVFTTEDSIDIFIGDTYWFINIKGKMYSMLLTDKTIKNQTLKRFSTKEKAQEYLDSLKVPEWVIHTQDKHNQLYKVVGDAPINDCWRIITKNDEKQIHKSVVRKATEVEVEAHLKGFHIGDKVNWTGNDPTTGVIKSFHNDGDSICAKLNLYSYNSCALDYLKHFEEEPKFITEDGDKLYGDDKCWLINSCTLDPFEDNYDIWSGDSLNIDKCKYFSKKENADQYWAELQAEKGGIKIGIEIFSYPEKIYQGQVTSIIYSEEHIGNIAFCLNRNINNIYTLKEIPGSNIYLSLEELAKEEGLEIGNMYHNDLMLAWINSYTYYPYFPETEHEVKGFLIWNNVPVFKQQHGRYLNIKGFKKFKEEWEAKQIPRDGLIAEFKFDITIKDTGCTTMGVTTPKVNLIVKDSDLDIDKTCETCICEYDYKIRGFPCNECSRLAGLKDHWQPKEFKFEVGRWYKHLSGSYGLYNGSDAENGGFDTVWTDVMVMEDPNQWELANMKEVKVLLLEEAKKRFPTGTKLESTLGNRVIVNDEIIRFDISLGTKSSIYANGIHSVYSRGIWAEVAKLKISKTCNVCKHFSRYEFGYPCHSCSRVFKRNTKDYWEEQL